MKIYAAEKKDDWNSLDRLKNVEFIEIDINNFKRKDTGKVISARVRSKFDYKRCGNGQLYVRDYYNDGTLRIYIKTESGELIDCSMVEKLLSLNSVGYTIRFLEEEELINE